MRMTCQKSTIQIVCIIIGVSIMCYGHSKKGAILYLPEKKPVKVYKSDILGGSWRIRSV